MSNPFLSFMSAAALGYTARGIVDRKTQEKDSLADNVSLSEAMATNTERMMAILTLLTSEVVDNFTANELEALKQEIEYLSAQNTTLTNRLASTATENYNNGYAAALADASNRAYLTKTFTPGVEHPFVRLDENSFPIIPLLGLTSPQPARVSAEHTCSWQNWETGSLARATLSSLVPTSYQDAFLHPGGTTLEGKNPKDDFLGFTAPGVVAPFDNHPRMSLQWMLLVLDSPVSDAWSSWIARGDLSFVLEASLYYDGTSAYDINAAQWNTVWNYASYNRREFLMMKAFPVAANVVLVPYPSRVTGYSGYQHPDATYHRGPDQIQGRGMRMLRRDGGAPPKLLSAVTFQHSDLLPARALQPAPLDTANERQWRWVGGNDRVFSDAIRFHQFEMGEKAVFYSRSHESRLWTSMVQSDTWGSLEVPSNAYEMAYRRLQARNFNLVGLMNMAFDKNFIAY